MVYTHFVPEPAYFDEENKRYTHYEVKVYCEGEITAVIEVGLKKEDMDFVYSQMDNVFVCFREYCSHYTILDVRNGDKYQIPKKETCIKLCKLMNDLIKEEGDYE